ncbi:hypothetical protein FDZ71_13115 [bacterium]|nr:MAG: hypothetical protein FDZ71_13115 [bacterium]
MSGDFKVWVWEGLDLSTDGDAIAAVNQGDQYFYGSTGLIQRWKTWFEGEVFDVIVPKLERSTGKVYNVQDAFQSPYGWWGTIYGGFSLDSEAPATANALSFTLKTNDVQRQHWHTPQDIAENVNLDMLRPQLEVAWAIAHELANIGEMGIPWSATMPMRFFYGPRGPTSSDSSRPGGWYRRTTSRGLGIAQCRTWWSRPPSTRRSLTRIPS